MSNYVHLIQFCLASCGCIEEVELVKLTSYLVALFNHLIVSKVNRDLCKLVETFIVVEFLRCVKSNLDISTADSKVKSLFKILFKEKCDLLMSLLLQVVDNCITAELAFAKDLFNLQEIVLLERHLELVVGIVNLHDFHLTLSCDCVYLILHEE